MCGIVGYTGPRPAAEVLLGGLKRLEYRGYDSSGMAVLDNGSISLRRSEGKLSALTAVLEGEPLSGATGIGHTRWATHGRPSQRNAHPHVEGAVAVVHNGIIENYLALKGELAGEGAEFKSETDSEIISHLLNRALAAGSDLAGAVRSAVRLIKGSFAFAAVSEAEPDTIVAARMECPLVVGLSDGETILSSDITAILDITRRALFVHDGEIVVVTKGSVELTDFDGNPVEREEVHIDWSPVMAEKGGYRHFMLKEIFEQPSAVTNTFRPIIDEGSGTVFLDGFEIDLKRVDKLFIIACGTSWHAALSGKYIFEELCSVPVEVDLASEFRYRNPLVTPSTLIIAISQSGETADTLAAVAEAKRRGAAVISICNVMESSLTREADWSFMTHAGPEIGVASTKAFTTQLTALYLLAVHFGSTLGRIDGARGTELIHDLITLPKKIEAVLEGAASIEKLAKRYFHHRDFIYIGRGINFPIALEGALKLKEISYIHAEGYAAGEMKHGPIALIDEDMPVVALAPRDKTYPKMLSNMEEVSARLGRLIAVVNEGATEVSSKIDTITVPEASVFLTPIILTVPLQLLAYYIAVKKGTDVDQPRNLAKSVTVE